MKMYITMGQQHIHRINGVVIDKDCVVVIDCEDYATGRATAFKLFGDKFFTTYTDDTFSDDDMIHFPRGYLHL